jgi:hypothetical protein
METVLRTVLAHYDGTQIQLDADLRLRPGTRLLVTILDDTSLDEALVREAMVSSEAALARVWENEEDSAYDHL